MRMQLLVFILLSVSCSTRNQTRNDTHLLGWGSGFPDGDGDGGGGAVHDVPELGLSCLSAAATAHWGRTRKRGIFQSIIDVNNL